MSTREKIENILTEIVPGIDLTSDDLMNEEGVGSLTVIEIISQLDIAFDIKISFNDIANNCFHSVDAIEEMINSHAK